jgi:ABC-type uncharacterized transport system YnjBCD permease subunit
MVLLEMVKTKILETESDYAAQAGLELPILLPQLPEWLGLQVLTLHSVKR